MDFEARARNQGIKILHQKDGKKEKKLLKVEAKGGKASLVLYSRNMSLAGRSRKAIELTDIRSVARVSDSTTPRAGRGLSRLGSASSATSLMETSFYLRIHVNDPGQSFDIAAYTDAETVDIERCLVKLLGGPPAEVAEPVTPLEQADAPYMGRSPLQEKVSPASYASAKAAFMGDMRARSVIFGNNGGAEADQGASTPERRGLARGNSMGGAQGLSDAVPELPAHYVQRPEELKAITDLITKSKDARDAAARRRSDGGGGGDTQGSMACLLSPTATGKTVLAVAAMHDDAVRATCDDAVVWLDVGRGGARRLASIIESTMGQLSDLGGAAAGRSGGSSAANAFAGRFVDVVQAAEALAALTRALLAARAAAPRPIIVLDDVWEPDVVQAFEEVGLRLLVTTRSDRVARRVGLARTVTVGGLEPAAARTLLCRAARTRRLPPDARGILAALGSSPLAVAAAGAALQHAPSWDGFLSGGGGSGGGARRRGGAEPDRSARSIATSGSSSTLIGGGASSYFEAGAAQLADGTDGENGGGGGRERGGGGKERSRRDSDAATAKAIAAGTAAAAVTNGSTVGAAAATVAAATPQLLAATVELRGALFLAMNALPAEFREMYDMIAALPPALPLTAHLLAALWEVEEGTAALLASSMESLSLLQRRGPGVFALGYDLHAAVVAAAADNADASARHLLALSNAMTYLGALDTLCRYVARGEVPLLLALWGGFEPHAACGCYVSHLGALRAEADALASRGIGQAHMDVAIAANLVSEFAVAAGCACALEALQGEVNALADALGADEDDGGAPLPPAGARALRRLRCRLGVLYSYAARPDEAIPQLRACLDGGSSSSAQNGGGGGGYRGSDTEMLSSSCAAVLEERSCENLGRALLYTRGAAADAEAEALYARAAAARAADPLLDEPLAAAMDARAWLSLADLVRRAGSHERATDLYKRAQALRERALGPAHPTVAACMEGQGKVALARGRGAMPEAEAKFAAARALREAYFLDGHPSIAAALEREAEVRSMLGDLEGARARLQRCLDMRTAAFGETDRTVGETLHMLAAVLLRQLRGMSTTEGGGKPPLNARTPSMALGASPFDRLAPRSAPYTQVPEAAPVIQQAEAFLRRALSILEGFSGEGEGTMTAESGDVVAMLYRLLLETGRIGQAEPLAERWVTWLEDQGRTEDSDYARAVGDLIGIQRALGGPGRDVESRMYDLLAAERALYGDESLEVAADQDALAKVLMEKMMHCQAEPLLVKSLKTRRAMCGAQSLEVARTLSKLGATLLAQHAYKKAEETFREAFKINAVKRGFTHPDTVANMRSIGLALCRQVKYEEAEPFYEKVVKADYAAYGTEECTEVINELNVLAVLRYAMGRLDAAEPMLRKVLELREKVVGPNHPDVADSLINLAALLNSKSRYSDALPLLERALDVCRAANGTEHPDTVACLDRIAETHQKMSNFDLAEVVYAEALEINERMHGKEHYSVAETLSDLGELLHRTGRLLEAEDVHKRALAIRETLFGPHHETVKESCLCLSLLMGKLGRTQEAEFYQEKASQVREKLGNGGRGFGRGGASGRGGGGLQAAAGERRKRKDPTQDAVNRSVTALPTGE